MQFDIHFLLLCVFAFCAGCIDAMVGGGGLIQLPALFILQPQLTLLQTLAINKTASFTGTIFALQQYLKKIKPNLKIIIPAIIMAFLGSFLGAYLSSFFRKETFTPIIIMALIGVWIYTIFKPNFGNDFIEKLNIKKAIVYAIVVGFVIGFYDGLIGPGTGSFLLFIFIAIFGYSFLVASTYSKIINATTNIAALIFYFSTNNIIFKMAIPIAICNLIGSIIGSKIALKKGNIFVRNIFIVVVALLICKLIFDYLSFLKYI